MADYPFRLANRELQARLEGAFDREGKIPRALLEVGPLEGRDTVLLDGDGGFRARQLESLAARVVAVPDMETRELPDSGADVIVGCWGPFTPSPAFDDELRQAARLLRAGGRLLIVHDYGRDQASRLLWDEDQRRALVDWSRRDGWFLTRGFRIRVVHCWWVFDTLEDAAEVLGAGFGSEGQKLADEIRRPRLAHNVVIYHRGF